jgi:hypothetical protein
MKVKFIWHISKIWADLRPICIFNDTTSEFKSCLSGLLTDDGGVSSFSYIEWVNIGLNKLENVMHSKKKSELWSSNSWAGEIFNDRVTLPPKNVSLSKGVKLQVRR